MGDMEKYYNDGNSYIFNHLGKTKFDSFREMTNAFRYSIVCQSISRHAKDNKLKKVKILDFGCSSGTFRKFWDLNHTDNQLEIEYLGLEIREKVVEQTNKLFEESKYDNSKVLQFDLAKDLDSLSGEFDVIINQEIIEHVEKSVVLNMIKKSYDVLKKNGLNIVSSPNPKKKDGQEFVFGADHFYEYDINEITKILEDHKFKIEDMTGWHARIKRTIPKLTLHEKIIYDKIHKISPSTALLMVTMMRPDLADCYILLCKKRNNKDLTCIK